MSYEDTYRFAKMVKLKIKKTKNADTRSCDDYTKVTRQELLDASMSHISDVQKGLKFFGDMLGMHGSNHDFDKLEDIDGFHANFLTGFEDKEWLERHYEKNRHHLENLDAIPEDVNLLDVLDHITDQVMAGMGRLGEPRPIRLSGQLLQLAVGNTIKLLADAVVVVED